MPNPDYDYFRDIELRPFHAHVRGLDLAKAWWLAELCFLVYLRDPESIGRHLKRAEMQGATFVQRGDYRALLAHDDAKAILVFRGTDIRSMDNWLTDFRVRFVQEPSGARLHGGFVQALDRLWDDLEPRLERLGARPLWVTGHSLGGALATLAARRRHETVHGLCTFGSPRVGDAAFRDSYPPIPSWRVVNEHDLVTVLPPPVSYRHVGRTMHLRRDGTILDGTDLIDRLRDGLTDRLPGIFRGASNWREIVKRAVRENALADHSPINYALRLWNLTE
ncbi:MAG: lipase family protein [Planctomycetes bacterium]|nr:lipase family protein [Planctomycetota bacterium]